ncbi:peptide ABC transporter substrate-binding protein [Litoribacterium kuwaitense]|uniref:peptide ABC transporter substrate-binding protein n=1 Tax=Litoribacterium kuwaitense TaxID=1398745 RepID=UPI0028A7C157|nr:peptide ABC transporter substrate-binding protein [Litoribacterium kuwaitense]
MLKKSTKLWLFALMAALMLVIAACGNEGAESDDNTGTEGEEGTEEQATEGDAAAAEQVLNLAESDEISTMDTTQATDTISFTAMNNAFEGLYRLDENDQVVLGMAAEEPEVSEDGLTYTFTLRDATWSNGDPVTANDFVYAWQKALHPDTLSPYAYAFAPVKNATAITTEGSEIFGQVDQLGVEAVDEKTLKITLEQAVPYFDGLLAFGPYYPQPEKFAEEQGSDYGTSAETIVFNGPFTMTEWNPGADWQFQKNADYWDADTVQLDEVNVRVVKQQQTGINLYETGEIDQKWGLKGEFVPQYKDSEEYYTFNESSLFYLQFNFDIEHFANENIRRAIELAYDKEAHAQVILNNGSVGADYFMPQGLARTDDSTDYREIAGEFNTEESPEEANEYFQQGLEELGKDSIAVDLLVDDTDGAVRSAEYIQEQLMSNLEGLEVTINQQPFNQRLALTKSGDFEMVISGWGPDYQDPNTFLDMFLCGGGNNHGNYCNEAYDAKVAEANAETEDLQKRFELFAEAEQILLEEDVAISPIYQRGIAYLRKPYVKDLLVHSFGAEFSYKWASIEGSKQ